MWPQSERSKREGFYFCSRENGYCKIMLQFPPFGTYMKISSDLATSWRHLYLGLIPCFRGLFEERLPCFSRWFSARLILKCFQRPNQFTILKLDRSAVWMITILQKQVFCLSQSRVKASMASNQMSQYHIQMWYHVTCYTRDFAPVKFERLGIWPRFFHQRSSIEIPAGRRHNITQQISRKCVVDDKSCESDTWWLKDKVLTSPQTVSISWRSLEAHQRLCWISLRRSWNKVSIVICFQTSANLQDNILIFRNWVAKHWPAPKHPVRHIDLWSLAPRLRIWTLGLRSLSSSWRVFCSGCFSFPFSVLKLTFWLDRRARTFQLLENQMSGEMLCLIIILN